MRTCCGCDPAAPAENRSRWAGRTSAVLQWLIPCGVLLATPKCPLYFAAATGIGLSTATAGVLRAALLSLSVALIAGVSLRAIVRFSRVRGG